jgi:hypothetical protein
VCRATHKFKIDRFYNETDEDYRKKCLQSLSKNFSLLSILSHDIKSKKSEEFDLNYCEEHNLPIHSFTEKPASELCDECIVEVQEMGLEIKPIPQISQYLDRIIEKILENLAKNKESRENLANSVKVNEHQEVSRGENIVNTFFQKLVNICDEKLEENSKTLKKLGRELKEKQKGLKEEVDLYKTQIESVKNQLNYLKNLKDSDLCRNLESVEGLLSNLDLKHFKVSILQMSSNKSSQNLQEILKTCIKIGISKKTEKWICPNCQTSWQKGLIFCEKCEIFRPISSYPGLHNSLPLITDEEANELNRRRTEELALFKKLNQIDADGTYFMISSNWLDKWKAYLFDRSLATSPGQLPPDEISNHSFFENEECTKLKAGLLPMLDYRVLNSEVWSRLFSLYGGGPPLKRKKLSIYMNKFK